MSDSTESSSNNTALNWTNLETHLANHGLVFDANFTPSQFETGFGNLNFLIRLDNKFAVLRRPPFGELPPGANDMAREFRVIQGLNNAFPLAPEAIHFCDSNEVLGAPFLIMEYLSGTVIGGDIPQDILQIYAGNGELNNPGTAEIGVVLADHLVDILARLHELNPARAGLETLGKPQGFVARTVKGWNTRARLAWDESPPDHLSVLVDWLEQYAPADHSATLIHNDFKLDNVILDSTTLNPIGVIDWDMCTRGAPLYDLAVLLSYWTEHDDPAVMHALRQMPTAANGFPTREQVAMNYTRITGTPLRDFTFFRVLATLRIAVVFKQLYRRYETGASNNKQLARFDGFGEDLLRFGVEISNEHLF